MKKVAGLAFVLLMLGGGVAAVVYLRVNRPYRGFEGAEQFVELPAGSGSLTIGQRLVASGVVRDATTFRTALWMGGRGRQLKAGEYRFDRPVAPLAVIGTIA